ncbi:hypothetical protein BGW42_007455 [Actinomortierella wolfii]|nr:hypothetical protein BGW42_007455 [Actinomortierella wolfii]
MSFWVTASGPARRAVAPGSAVQQPYTSPVIVGVLKARLAAVASTDVRRSITHSRPLGRGEDVIRNTRSKRQGASTKPSSSSAAAASARSGGDRKSGRKDTSSKSAQSSTRSQRGRNMPILDFTTVRLPKKYSATTESSTTTTTMTDRISSKRAATAAAAAAAVGGASVLYQRQVGNAGSSFTRGKPKPKDDSSDDEDDEEWLDRKRRPRDGMWPRGGVEAVDDDDNNEDRSTLPRGLRGYDSDHEDDGDGEDEDDEDPEYVRKYASKRTSRITQSKERDAEYLYHPNVALPALLKGYRKIHKLYIINSYNRDRHPEIKKCVEAAAMLGISPIKVDRHTLNTLSENRPHSGVVLEAGPLKPISIESLGAVEAERYQVNPKGSRKTLLHEFQHGKDEPPVWVALDEVVDPQNMGAILRSSFFLGADGVVVCSKNSAPLSPVVAKASSGALEARHTYTVQSMMKFLQASQANGWQVVGAHVTYGSKRMIPYHQWPESGVDRPTILVMGNEGSGIRKMIQKYCDYFIQIPPLSPMDDVVDSLNVGTATGIILTRFVGARFAHLPKNLKKYRFRGQQRDSSSEDDDENNDEDGDNDQPDDTKEPEGKNDKDTMNAGNGAEGGKSPTPTLTKQDSKAE